jgi:hypothetical protein
MRLAETTNGRLIETRKQIDQLVEWADADADHAEDNDAPSTAKDDRRRARKLRKARALLDECLR